MSAARINLLPWREEERKRKNIEFGIMSAAAAALVLGIVVAVLMFYNERISFQQQRNSFLQNEINVLNAQLETIKELETTKANLLARMNIIQELQVSRPEIVHLFEELVVAIPEGIWLTSVKQDSGKIRISGMTESNARVSAFMRNLDESKWLKEPKLSSIKKSNDGSAAFELDVFQQSPSAEETE